MTLCGATGMHAQASPAATVAFENYCRDVERRIGEQHRSTTSFLAAADGGGAPGMPGNAALQLQHGEVAIERLTPADAEVSGALLHHWRGTAFAAGAHAADFDRLLRDFAAYPRYFSPEVVRSSATDRGPGRVSVAMRVRQRHVLTVVMDIDFDVSFGRMDGARGWSTSRSTRVAEIEGADTNAERALPRDEEHGFLWRTNTYWSYEERDGGVYLQIESVSLTRAVPRGLGWAIRSYVESIPRESLAFTLTSARRWIAR